MKNSISDRNINLLIIGVMAVFAALYYPLWLTNEEILSHDAILWFGSYAYTADSLLNGHLPLWDPYGQAGNSFYQNLSLLGLLEPISLFYILLVKIFSISILKSYIYLSITRVIFMSVGAYFAYKQITGFKNSAKVAGAAFFMAIFSSSLHQNGFVNLFMMMPWILYFTLKYLDKIGERGASRYLYGAVTALGISFNIYVPVYTIFFLSVFFLISFLTGAVRIPGLKTLLQKSVVKELSVAFAIILLFSAGPASSYIKDMGSNGELYPFLRSYTSSVGAQKMMVSEKGKNALSSEHYSDEVITGTFLNLTQIIAPYYWEVKWKLSLHRFFQETFQFIGLSSILIIFATLLVRSRFKWATILTTVIVALFMSSLVASNPPLFYHKILSTLFPFLKLIKVYESFLGGYLFSLALLLAMGLSCLEDESKAEAFYQKYLHLRWFVIFCFAVYGLMAALLLILFVRDFAITQPGLEKYFFSFRTYVSINLKTLAYFAVVISLIVVGIYAKNRRRLTHSSAYLLVASLIFFELLFYNLPFNSRQITLSPNYLKDDDPVVHLKKPDIYENYRGIYLPAYFRFVTFQEALMKKGAVLPDVFHGMGNVVFVSKRYYELIVHLPKENIFAVSGLTSPKTRFFESAYITNDRNDVLKKMSSVSPQSLNGSLLFIEADDRQEFKQFERAIPESEYLPSAAVSLDLRVRNELIKDVFPVKGAFSARHFKKIEDSAIKEDWNLYSLDFNNIDEHPLFENRPPEELLRLNRGVDLGRMIVLKESQPPVLLYGQSESSNPVFLNSQRSYGDMGYLKEKGPPVEVFTVRDGSIISSKPFDGYLLLDTMKREETDGDKRIKNIAFDSNEAVFSIKNERPGFFYYADGWSPYWKAYDNDRPVEVLKANYNFKAVFLSAGDHIVKFVFEPWHFIAGMACYFGGLTGGLFLAFIGHVSKKKRPIPDTE